MKKLFAGTTRTRFIAVASAFTCLIAVATSEGATQLKEARVTQVVNDVKLLPQQAAPRPAVVSDPVRPGTAVRTGTQSRSELTFTDLTISRLGANTIFSFNQGTRQMNLTDGAILFQVPKGSGGATIKTAAVTAAITGTTGIGEFHPATTSNALPFSKWLCLEGTFHLYLANGQSVELGPGKMVTTDGKSFSKVLDFDIGKLVKSSLFFIGFDTKLASLDLIALEAQKQLGNTTENFLDPMRIINVIDQAIVAETSPSPSVSPSPSPSVSPSPSPSVSPSPSPSVSPTPPPTPSPTPSKFGRPSVISSPVPYVITSGTTISTDPAITTNGVTDFGKIYRGPAIDGPFSAYAFGSTSPFDTASGFDAHFDNAGHFPGAVFKFTSLELAGNPTISTANGGVTNLALISVGDITSGLPGGTLTFSGLDALLLATQNGSINLGSEIAFENIPTLLFYARGIGSNLTLNSPISGTTDLSLRAEGNILVTNSLTVSQTNNGLTDGLNILLLAGGNIDIGSDLSLTTDASNIQTGGNVVVTSGGNTLIGGSFELTTSGLSGTATGTGGNIIVTTGGNLAAGDLNFTVNYNVLDVTVANGANLTINVAGDLTTTLGGVRLTILTPVADTLTLGGNIRMTIGGDLNLAEGGDLVLTLVNTISTTVPNGANLFVSIGGDLNANAVRAQLENEANGGIGTGGNLTFNVSGNLSASSLLAQVNNTDGGHITNGGNLTLHVSGTLMTTGDATFYILNNDLGNGSGGGTIGSNATINVSAANISTGNALDATIDNTGGTIGGNATINMNVSGSATVASDATFEILGSDDAAAAAININGGSYDAGGTFLALIDGNGAITFNNASVHADVLKVGAFGTNGVLNIGGGTLSADTTLKLYAPGSNGQLNFISNVTLGGNSAKILAADSVTIFNGVVVTIGPIGSENPANVYTNNANYTGSGGNESTTGTFAGAGANDPQPLSSAPPFDDPPPSRATVTSGGNITTSKKTTRATINVSDSGQLLSLLDAAPPGPGGKITIPRSKIASNWRNSSRINAAGRLNADRRTAEIRTASSFSARRLPQ